MTNLILWFGGYKKWLISMLVIYFRKITTKSKKMVGCGNKYLKKDSTTISEKKFKTSTH